MAGAHELPYTFHANILRSGLKERQTEAAGTSHMIKYGWRGERSYGTKPPGTGLRKYRLVFGASAIYDLIDTFFG